VTNDEEDADNNASPPASPPPPSTPSPSPTGKKGSNSAKATKATRLIKLTQDAEATRATKAKGATMAAKATRATEPATEAAKATEATSTPGEKATITAPLPPSTCHITVQVGLLRERVQEAKEQAGKMVYDPTLDLAAAAAEVYNFKDIRAVRMRQVKASYERAAKGQEDRSTPVDFFDISLPEMTAPAYETIVNTIVLFIDSNLFQEDTDIIPAVQQLIKAQLRNITAKSILELLPAATASQHAAPAKLQVIDTSPESFESDPRHGELVTRILSWTETSMAPATDTMTQQMAAAMIAWRKRMRALRQLKSNTHHDSWLIKTIAYANSKQRANRPKRTQALGEDATGIFKQLILEPLSTGLGSLKGNDFQFLLSTLHTSIHDIKPLPYRKGLLIPDGAAALAQLIRDHQKGMAYGQGHVSDHTLQVDDIRLATETLANQATWLQQQVSQMQSIIENTNLASSTLLWGATAHAAYSSLTPYTLINYQDDIYDSSCPQFNSDTPAASAHTAAVEAEIEGAAGQGASFMQHLFNTLSSAIHTIVTKVATTEEATRMPSTPSESDVYKELTEQTDSLIDAIKTNATKHDLASATRIAQATTMAIDMDEEDEDQMMQELKQLRERKASSIASTQPRRGEATRAPAKGKRHLQAMALTTPNLALAVLSEHYTPVPDRPRRPPPTRPIPPGRPPQARHAKQHHRQRSPPRQRNSKPQHRHQHSRSRSPSSRTREPYPSSHNRGGLDGGTMRSTHRHHGESQPRNPHRPRRDTDRQDLPHTSALIP